MAFSATKSVLSLVAGIAFDDGLLSLDEPVRTSVNLPQFADEHGRGITWRHLLDQTSQWEGELWGKPTGVDAQSTREGLRVPSQFSVSFTTVQPRTGPCGRQDQHPSANAVEQGRTPARRQQTDLDSVLGATPREFESRILRIV
ncbi:beta-lactamase family protein [Streptomyces sp. RB6PN25]|uniref:Beta-lactamase family protein n=1 Tax=Streptomyces humicola TaxID=2953240 RepID=A0ABT1Q3E1_9ACTN|nr:serine hydrolase domain-containing protein [Streptomyces humicola]MCQ4084438.1 beta-lactamase family protein [Streptomyces humicola]